MKKTWSLIGVILTIICCLYVPWYLPPFIREKYGMNLRYLPIFSYNWFWQMPDLYRGKAVVDYFRVFLNILTSISGCFGGYIITSFITEFLSRKKK